MPGPRGAADHRKPPLSVRFMDDEHLAFVVAEHRRCFPDGFFARLGPRFLTAYTRTYLTSPHAVGFVAELAGEPVGYLVGIVDPTLHRRHLLRTHGLRLALQGAAGLLLRPGLAARFARTRLSRYYRKLRPGAPVPQSPAAHGVAAVSGREAVLAHIAVVEPARGRGAGAELIGKFMQFATLAGCSGASLVTAAGPDGAGAYYAARGWQLRGQSYTPEQRPLLTYVRDLQPPA
ncbi:MAG: GNAT family N-acetyltransferase [Streptomyces sp.]